MPNRHHLLLAAIVVAVGSLTAACTSSNNSSSNPPPASTLKWYSTCGGPICPAPDSGAATADAGLAECSASEKEGSACSTQGATCDAHLGRGAVLECADHDPKSPARPISSRTFKHDIAYLSDEELSRVRDEALSIRLATYAYNQGDGRSHLGFILEDSPEIPAADMQRLRVDLYAYASMILATTQLQQREIGRLESDLVTLEARYDRFEQACSRGHR